MKKMIIILSVLFTLILTGVLYGTNIRPEKVETVMVEQVYMYQFPDPIPDFMLY